MREAFDQHIAAHASKRVVENDPDPLIPARMRSLYARLLFTATVSTKGSRESYRAGSGSPQHFGKRWGPLSAWPQIHR